LLRDQLSRIIFLAGLVVTVGIFVWDEHDEAERQRHLHAKKLREQEAAEAEYLRRQAISDATAQADKSTPKVDPLSLLSTRARTQKNGSMKVWNVEPFL